MAWTAHLDGADRALMVTELRACLVTLEHSGDPVPLETCLAEWRGRARARMPSVPMRVLFSGTIRGRAFPAGSQPTC